MDMYVSNSGQVAGTKPLIFKVFLKKLGPSRKAAVRRPGFHPATGARPWQGTHTAKGPASKAGPAD
jgi:hypothetical protein